MICDEAFWKENQSIDEEIEFNLDELFPASEQPYDVDGSGLLGINWSGDRESLTNHLIFLGFKTNQEFLDCCDDFSNSSVNKDSFKKIKSSKPKI